MSSRLGYRYGSFLPHQYDGDLSFLINGLTVIFGRELLLVAATYNPGHFIAVSNHIAPNTPVESAILHNQVYDDLLWR